jgi:hypothetical protein
MVENTNPSGSGSLADAIASANGNDQANTIAFDPVVFDTPQTIVLGGSALVLSDQGGPQAITGPTAGLFISGGAESGVFVVDQGVTASISGLSIIDGVASRGGGLDNECSTTLTDCTFEDNLAGLGGAIYNDDGALTVIDSTFVGNSTPNGAGGGIYDFFATATLIESTLIDNTALDTGSGTGSGGGIYNFQSTLKIIRSDLSGNAASHNGGGIRNSGGNVTVIGSTLSADVGDSTGGGIANASGGTLQLIGSTLSGDFAASGGGIYNHDSADLVDTIVAGNTSGTGASDIGGTGAVSGIYNLIGTGGSGGLTDGTNGNIVLASLTNLGLAPLGDYGGPTDTMALLPGSFAVGDGTAVSGVTTDQRGFSLPAENPDIGAFQTGPLVVNTTIDGTGASSGDLSLRQAINVANSMGVNESISFDGTVFAHVQTIALTAGPLVVGAGVDTIAGPTAGVTISGGGQSGVLEIDSGVTAILSGLTITDGQSMFGGGVLNYGSVTLTGCTIDGNTATSGGGLDNSSGTVTLTGCTIVGNTATSGGGLDNSSGTVKLIDCTIVGNTAGAGGGVLNDLDSRLLLKDCTIVGNSAKGGFGGGVFNAFAATLIDCTISGNSAKRSGGGLENLFAAADAELIGCTIVGNSAGSGGGASNFEGTLSLVDTIVAGNTLPGSSAPSDFVGSDVEIGSSNNLIGTGGSGGLMNGSYGNIVLASLASLDLAPLGDYGGPTETIALLPGSAAIGMGVAFERLAADQRGFARPANNPDIGAFQTGPLVVNTDLDGTGSSSGDLSLRQAINLLDAAGGPSSTIAFNLASDQRTITPTSPLPPITKPVDIAGDTEPGYSASPVVVVAGDSAGSFTNGLTLAAGSSGSTIQGLVINDFAGYGIDIESTNDRVIGNEIGTNPDGDTAMSNGTGGVYVNGSGATIGGTATGAGNVIAFNHGPGVATSPGTTGTTIRANSIFLNLGPGIDVNDDGVSYNAPDGPNNTPVVTSAGSIIAGTLNASPRSDYYTIDFYANPSGDASAQSPQGRIYLGSTTVTTNTQGNVSFRFSSAPIAVGSFVTATSTDASGTTSEFSTPVVAYSVTATGLSLNATAGVPFQGQVASFTSPDLAAAAVDFTAVIDYGDGTPSAAGTVVAAPGGFVVVGLHTFTTANPITPVSVTITDMLSLSQGTANSLADVASRGGWITPFGVTPQFVAGTLYTRVVASFTDTDPKSVSGQFNAIVNWGDGTANSIGDISADGAGFDVSGSHSYNTVGSYPVTVSINDTLGGATVTASSTATVAPIPITIQAKNFAVTGKKKFSGAVATFTDGDPRIDSTFYTATINWGDGSANTTGVITGNNPFTVTASHTFQPFANTDLVTITITDKNGRAATAVDRVVDPPAVLDIHAGGITLTADKAFLGTVASFSDSGPAEAANAYEAIINWGAGRKSAGMITGRNGRFVVSARHVFPRFSGAETVTITVTDAQGQVVSARESASYAVAHRRVIKSTRGAKIASKPLL